MTCRDVHIHIGSLSDLCSSGCFRVCLLIDLLQSFNGHVSVHLSGGKTFMSEQFLHGHDVRTIVEQMRGEGVTEDVRTLFGDLRRTGEIL
jgi:hypothetical protein